MRQVARIDSRFGQALARLQCGAALVLSATLGAMPAAAQQSAGAQPAGQRAEGGPLSLGIAGGFARANNSLGSAEIGYQAHGTLEYRTRFTPLRLRTDALYTDFGGEGFRSLTFNVLVSPLPRSRVAPYVLAGAGGYAERYAGVKSGWTLGVGLRIPAARGVFIESRLHQFRRDPQEFPAGMPRPLIDQRFKSVVMPLSIGFQF